MSPFLLISLKARLILDLADFSLPGEITEGARLRPVSIHIGDLPPTRSDDPDPQPFVLLVPVSGLLQGNEIEICVALICGIYNAEEGDAEGVELDMAVLLSALARSLFPCRKEPLEARYRLTEDAKGRLFPWEKSDIQPRPYIQATVMTHWRMKGLE